MPEAAGTYTHSHVVLDGGRVTFGCSTDTDRWPWLDLHPFDPIVVQSINYWASIESGAARGTFDTAKRTALTKTAWTCGDPSVGHATHGFADEILDQGTLNYKLTFLDAHESVVCEMTGKGVVFKNRDFKSWRDEAKQVAAGSIAFADFPYVSAEAVGVATQAECFLSPLDGRAVPAAQGLITKDNGFMPDHPTHGGSGDHVNANHLGDIARQFAVLLNGGAPLICTGGAMRFKKYVELGRPFDIALEPDGQTDESVSMTVHQADELCAAISLNY